MIQKVLFAIVVSIVSSALVFGQDSDPTPTPINSRVTVTDNVKITPTPTPRKVIIVGNNPTNTPIPIPTASPSINNPSIVTTPGDAIIPPPKPLRYAELKSKIDEAKRQMTTKPLRISMVDSQQTHEIVRIAYFDHKRSAIDYVVVRKADFLNTKTEIIARSEGDQSIRIRTIRGNGVNTPIIIYDAYNTPHLPLIVQYPVEKYGRFVEMAYYISTHPGLVTPDNVNAGKLYVRNVLNTASSLLRQKGIFIQPKVLDIAERLALVEHVDHLRFRTELHPNIYNDVYTLYALNQGNTYRYSVSSAGAGGMVQMIPSTYRMIRSRYYSVGLMPDFVEGMRNHVNASQAMLLYMQMTWNDLIAEDPIYNALESGIATQEQLMAAGYNSNPARLKLYIRRGGANWTNLIPRETKIYLQIYQSVERYVPMTPRTNE